MGYGAAGGATAIGTAAMSTLTTITILIVTILAVAIARAAEDQVDREELEDQADLAVLEGSVAQAESVDLAVLVESVELVAENGNTIHRIAVTHRMAIAGRRISLDKPTIVLAPVRALVPALVQVVAKEERNRLLGRRVERVAQLVVRAAVARKLHLVLPVEIKSAIVRHRKRVMETAAVHMVAGAAEITRAPAVIVAVAVWAAGGTAVVAAVAEAAVAVWAEDAEAEDAEAEAEEVVVKTIR